MYLCLILLVLIVGLLYYYSQPEWVERIVDCEEEDTVDMFSAEEFLRWLSDNRRSTER